MNKLFTWAGQHRLHAWCWLRRKLLWGVVFLLTLLVILDLAGVLLSMFPVTVEWKPVDSRGLPPAPPLSVQSLVVGPDGQNLFAGTLGGGIYRSNDRGETWQLTSEGLTAENVNVLVVGPDKMHLFAGTLGAGVFRSDDGGRTWQLANEGLTEPRVQALVVGPDGRSLFASTLESRIFLSSDNGQTWQLISEELRDADVRKLTVGPDGKSLFAGTLKAGVFRSTDDGETWQPANVGLITPNVQTLVVGPDGTSLFAGTEDDWIFRSDDMGQTWQRINEGLTSLDVGMLAVVPDVENLFAGTSAGVFRSNNEGQTWQPVSAGLNTASVQTMAMGPNGQSLFAGTSAGVFRSNNEGQTWQPASEGLLGLGIRALVVGPDGESLFAGSLGDGVFRSNDGGKTWQSVNQGLTELNVRALAVGPDVQSLFAGTLGGGVFCSKDKGQTWQPVNAGLTNLNILALLIDMDRRGLFAGALGGEIFCFEEEDQNWEPVPNLSFSDLPTSIVSNGVQLAVSEGSFSLSRQGMGWLRWATHRHQAPQTISIQGNCATLYALAGTTIMHAEVRLPAIWHFPTPYLAMVTVTWQGIDWIETNVVPISIGLGGLGVALMIVIFSLARSSGLPPGLLLRQRSALLQVGVGYRHYRKRWENGTPLEQLIVLLAPAAEPLDTEQLEQRLIELRVPAGADQLEAELSSAVRDGLFLRQEGGYHLTEPLLARTLQAHEGEDGQRVLAEQIRHDHPLCANARRFLDRAGFALAPVGEMLIYRCEPTSADLGRLLPSVVYARFLPGEELDADQVRVIHTQVKQTDADATVAFAITDRRPTDEGWAQIGTLRMEEFTILPIESALLNEGLASERERALLRTEVENRLGTDYDPYDVRDPVAGAFSFFGRDALVETLLRRITEGRSVGLFGLRKLGKTSLLQVLRNRASFPVAAVNLQTFGHDTLDELYMRILRYWRQWARLRYDMDWDSPSITHDDPTDAFVAAVLDWLDKIQRTQGEARLGLFLDEIELIVPRPDGSGPDLTRYLTLLRALRGLIDEDGRLSLVVSSLNPSINRINAWGDEQNPTFNLFQEVNLPPLTKDDCIQMVRNIGQQIGLVYSEASLQAISDLSGGHPFLARQLCSVLYKRHGRQAGLIETGEIPPGVQQFIYDDLTVTHLDAGIWRDAGSAALWGAANARINQSLLLDLAHADGPVPQDDILKGPDADARQTALINMERFHIVYQPEPSAYAIRFGLLRTWLRRRKLGLE